MATFTITFRKERETKNTFRYQSFSATNEHGSGVHPPVDLIYIAKFAFANTGAPDHLTITLNIP